MIVEVLVVGPLDTNCYIVGCPDAQEAFIIDPGFSRESDVDKVLRRIAGFGLRVRYIVNTHGHPDHTAGNAIMKKRTNAPVAIHEHDAPMLIGVEDQPVFLDSISISHVPADIILRDEDVIQVGKVRMNVLHTPGHTRGSVCLLGSGAVFTGDTLFAGSIGRTDLPGSSFEDIMRSIRGKLAKLPDDTRVCPGHGPASSIGVEKSANPFLRTLDPKQNRRSQESHHPSTP